MADQAGSSTSAATATDGTRRLLMIIVVLVLIAGLGAVFFIFVLGDDEAEAVIDVQLEPISSAIDPFAPVGQMGQDQSITPVETATPTTVEGGRVGLYGGTMNTSQCDKAQLAMFLQQNPDKGAEWARIVGVAPAAISTYIEGLTPVVLRSDTAVTNHGFKNGRATPLQSVLQAGTAVLVDAYGVPVTKCYCGNPLQPPYSPPRTQVTPPPNQPTTTPMNPTTTHMYPTTTYYYPPTYYPPSDHPTTPPRYIGTSWPNWKTTSVTIVQVHVTVIEVFTLVDPVTGVAFTRPAGTDGASDKPAAPVPVTATTTTMGELTPPPPPGPQPQPSPSPQPRPTTTVYYPPTTMYYPPTTMYNPPTTHGLPDEPCVDEHNNIVPCP